MDIIVRAFLRLMTKEKVTLAFVAVRSSPASWSLSARAHASAAVGVIGFLGASRQSVTRLVVDGYREAALVH